MGSHLEWTDGDIYWDAAWTTSNTNRTSGPGGTVTDTYHHYVYTYDGNNGSADGTLGELRVYKDNIQIAANTTTAVGGVIPWSQIRNLELGNDSFTNGFWTGDMDDFAIWNEVLSTQTRTAIFNNGIASVVPEPSALMPLVGGALSIVLRRRRTARL